MNRVENITDYKSSPTQVNYMLNGGGYFRITL